MRSGLVSTFCVFLFAIPRLAAAQSNPIIPLPPQAPYPKVSHSDRLAEIPRVAESSHRAFDANVRNGLAKLGLLPNFSSQERQGTLIFPLPSVADQCCGHIVIYQSPPDMDTASLLSVPKDFASNMPTFRGLPPCPQDFRNVPSNLGPLFLPDGAGRFNPRFPTYAKPSPPAHP
jgi:hypothetical protein